MGSHKTHFRAGEHPGSDTLCGNVASYRGGAISRDANEVTCKSCLRRLRERTDQDQGAGEDG